MTREADQIRYRIEDTRERMSETIDALGYKADIPERMKESVSEKAHSLSEKTQSFFGGVRDQGSETYGSVTDTGRRAGSLAQENPLMLALGGVAAGFLLGMLLPSTRMETERMGPMAQDIKSTVTDTAEEAFERGKEVAEEAVMSATQTVKEMAPQEGEELKQSFQQKAQGM
jgi:ElaB/YqjD/DUF883 family membrane-anchored ribosome-binding protein